MFVGSFLRFGRSKSTRGNFHHNHHHSSSSFHQSSSTPTTPSSLPGSATSSTASNFLDEYWESKSDGTGTSAATTTTYQSTPSPTNGFIENNKDISDQRLIS